LSRSLDIPTPRVFLPLLGPSRYKGAWGGRGSGKSHFFAEMMVEYALAEPGLSGEGLRAVCVREVQKTLKESAKRLLESKLAKHGLGEADGFKVYEDRLRFPKDGVAIFQGMQDHTAESIKSLEGFKVAWPEEAQSLSARSMTLLRPTIRAPGSELWFSWNPRRKVDPVDLMLRGEDLPTGATVVRANWSDNPWFPSELETERLDCLRSNPDQYDHIWEGGYVQVTEGAYYARCLSEMRAQGRLGKVAPDPLMQVRAFWDIGGTGAKADACSIWVAQFVGREIRVLAYYEHKANHWPPISSGFAVADTGQRFAFCRTMEPRKIASTTSHTRARSARRALASASSRTKARARLPLALRPFAACSRRSGLTKPQPDPALRPSARITRAKTSNG
jgi:phage terminase large subunit